jgi:hypothetical protein
VSYDIRLVLVNPGESVREVAYRDQVAEAQYTTEAKARNEMIIGAVIAQFPELKRFDSDRCVELTEITRGTGLQLSLYADTGGISVPYWHSDHAAEVLEMVDGVLRLVLKNGPFKAFDPQTDQELKPGTLGQSPSSAVYAVGVEAVRQIAKKPWWRFWS